MKVFVSGGSGFVGGYVLRELKARGHTPIALVRPGSERKLASLDGVKLVPGDVNLPASYQRAMEEADAVIHLVAIIRQFPSRGITFDLMNYHAARNMAQAAARAGVKRFIHMSANGAAPDGVSEYLITKWRAEELVRNSGLDWTIFRPSLIFGDSHGLPEFTAQLADVIGKAPVTPVFGSGAYTFDPISVEDVARVFVSALEMDRTIGRTFCLAGGRPIAFSELVQTVANGMGRPRAMTVNIPLWMILPAAWALDGFESFPVTADQIKMLVRGNVCGRLDYMDVFDITPLPFSPRNLEYLRG